MRSGRWGATFRQRVRLWPFYSAAVAADFCAPLVPERRRERLPAWTPGITVVIPERDAKALLDEALASLHAALARLSEPSQLVVVANGAPRATYADLDRAIELVHVPEPCAFVDAVARGVARARHDWTLLLNNDMRLDGEAIAVLAAARAEDVFAIGAQIAQRSASGRREETGFTDWCETADGTHLFHAPPPASALSPHLCASGGAALFRTALLRRYLPSSRAFDPFYWEDAEWSVRAWRDGWRVLFAKDALAYHRHRATTSRFYPSAELERIVERNRLLFDARHHASSVPAYVLMQRLCDLPAASQRELAAPRVAWGLLGMRVRARRAPQPLAPPRLWSPEARTTLPLASYSYRLRPQAVARRKLLVITPFAVHPPRHGGARRVAELVQALRPDHDIVLVSDEARLYDARSFAFFDGLHAVELVQRVDARMPGTTLEARIAAHCHEDLRRAVREAIALHDPDIVQIEHAELAALVDRRGGRSRWVLALHDAVRAEDFGTAAAFDAFSRHLQAFDAVTVCSSEDAQLVAHRDVTVVPNGSGVPLDAYVPSAGARLLFVGPFRYEPNAAASTRFLRDAYPRIRVAWPSTEIVILGGDEALQITRGDPLYAQAGVHVLGHRDDMPAELAGSALTVNPQLAIRGSAVKVIESLCAGRVCVSTEDGARGLNDAGLEALVTVPDVAAMAEAVIGLLRDPEERRRRERPDLARLRAFQWDACAAPLRALYGRLFDGASQ